MAASIEVKGEKLVGGRSHSMHFERKNSRPDISILAAYEITPTTIFKHVFHEITHEEVYICITILNVNAQKLKNKSDFCQTELLLNFLLLKYCILDLSFQQNNFYY